ncbi:hypothetical protein H4N49_36635 [Streptomyces sp. DHE17-7]|nr:hypothetical protein [Streptomyces sp. DHE17-7]
MKDKEKMQRNASKIKAFTRGLQTGVVDFIEQRKKGLIEKKKKENVGEFEDDII